MDKVGAAKAVLPLDKIAVVVAVAAHAVKNVPLRLIRKATS